MESNTQLIANTDAYEDSWKREKIAQIILLLKGALKAVNMVGLKMQFPEEKLERIIKVLPSLHAPTVDHLYNSTWLSVETIVEENVVRELIPQLVKAGANGIVEYPLNKVI
jgi:ATP phosphoribosyltransferase